MVRLPRAAAIVVAALAGGCVGVSAGSHDGWYATRDLPTPNGDKVFICHAFGCLQKTAVRFSQAEMALMGAPFAGPVETPEAERAAISQAVQRFEQIVGDRIGTSADTGGFERIGGGDPTQMDCIDEAANTTSLLVLLGQRGHLKHHRVAAPASRGILIDGRYPHNTAVVAEMQTGERYAIDSWPRDNARPPVIQPLGYWLRQRNSSSPDV